jgi:hypothetical protein
MIELPGSLREFVVERIEDELRGSADHAEWIRSLLAGLDALAEEMDEEDGENLIPNLEESGELEDSLANILKQQYEKLNEPSGDDLLSVVDKLCEIAWINEEADDEIARDFRDGTDSFDEDY